MELCFFTIHLLENSFVKAQFGLKFPGEKVKFFWGGGNPNFLPGNGPRINTEHNNDIKEHVLAKSKMAAAAILNFKESFSFYNRLTNHR